MASTYGYSFLRIPKESQQIDLFAQKYRQLRLSALELSPSSFSSTYATEAAFPISLWTSRLTRSNVETFICYATPTAQDPTDDPLEGDWVAQVTLLGPTPKECFELPPEARELNIGNDGEEEKWQMLALYTLPTHRGTGLGKGICLKVFDYLAKERPGILLKKVRIRIMIKPENTVVVGMYQRMGFVDAGRCTLAEALKANGDGDMVPQNGDKQKYHTRGGLILVKLLNIV